VCVRERLEKTAKESVGEGERDNGPYGVMCIQTDRQADQTHTHTHTVPGSSSPESRNGVIDRMFE
jgi:hypothetical protein